jgi:hypothetical protein
VSLPTDTSPLYDAVVNALTKWTGQPRAIPAEWLLREGLPKDLNRGPRAGEVLNPVFFIAPIEERIVDPHLQMTDRTRLECTIELLVWYYGHPTHIREWQSMRERAAADKRRILDALSYPSALYEDPRGRRTGLDGGSLRLDGDRAIVTGPVLAQGYDRVHRVTYRFRANVELTRA